MIRKKSLRLIKQGSLSECGLSCMAMILSYWGYKIDTLALRKLYPVSIQGTSLLDLKKIAGDINCNANGYSVDDVELLKQQIHPVIIQLNDNHFSILKGFKKGRFVVYDPAAGVRKIEENDFVLEFNNIVFSVMPNKHFKLGDHRSKLKFADLIKWDKTFTRLLTKAVILTVLVELLINIMPLFMQEIVDSNIPKKDYASLKTVLIAFFTVSIGHVIFSGLRSLVISQLSISVGRELLKNTAKKLISLPLSYFNQRNVGDIHSRFMSVYQVRSALSGALLSTVVDLFMGIIVVGILVSISSALTMVSVLILVLYSLVRWFRYKKFREYVEQATIDQSELNSYILESIRGIGGVKVSSIESVRLSQWGEFVDRNGDREFKNSRLEMLFSMASSSILQVEKALIIYLSAFMVLEGTLSLGIMIAFLTYKDQLVWRATSLMEKIASFGVLGVSIDRIKDIHCTQSFPGARLACDSNVNSIEFFDVVFSYSPFEKVVVDKISFDIPKNQHTVFVGRSGIGKSTIAKLMLGLIDPVSGQVRLGSGSKAAVMQGDRLFHGSIIENISMFEKKPDIGQIVRCSRMAEVHGDIKGFKMQYNSIIGDMGSMLSGGQVQRILLARALYRSTELLILDEATANIDAETEKKIINNLICSGLTLVSFSHRKTVIDSADNLLDLEEM